MVSCTNLDSPPVYEDVCIFTCDTDYELPDNAIELEYTCMANETWSSTVEPSCAGKLYSLKTVFVENFIC